jgi:hypothetical protein
MSPGLRAGGVFLSRFSGVEMTVTMQEIVGTLRQRFLITDVISLLNLEWNDMAKAPTHIQQAILELQHQRALIVDKVDKWQSF